MNNATALLQNLDGLNAQVLPRRVPEWSRGLDERAAQAEGAANLIIEGDNFDSLRLLKSTHAGHAAAGAGQGVSCG